MDSQLAWDPSAQFDDIAKASKIVMSQFKGTNRSGGFGTITVRNIHDGKRYLVSTAKGGITQEQARVLNIPPEVSDYVYDVAVVRRKWSKLLSVWTQGVGLRDRTRAGTHHKGY